MQAGLTSDELGTSPAEAGDAYQFSDRWLQRRLDESKPHWALLLDEAATRKRLIKRFHDYAMQWY